MVPAFDASQALAWLQTLYGETEGYINIVSTNNWAGKCFSSPADCLPYIAYLDKTGAKGIYARVTTLAAIPGPAEDGTSRRGSVEETKDFIGFWADIDIAGPGHGTSKPLPVTEADVMRIIEVTGLPQPTEWIHSGGGMYPWWLLDQIEHMDCEAQRTFGVKLAAEWQRLIELASESLGFSYGAGVGDLARVLRIPGTVNRKIADDPKSCVWRTELSASRTYSLDELTEALGDGLNRLTPERPAPKPAPVPVASDFSGGTRPGDAFNAATNWDDLLTADGAQVFKTRGIGYIEWTRPGKDRREGPSATTGHMGSDVLKVFTDMWPGLRQGETYDRFGYYAWTRHNGNIAEAARALSALGYGEKGKRNTDYRVQSDESWDWHPEAELIKTVTEKLAEKPKITSRPTYTFTDSGFADRMQARHGDDWRYVTTEKNWYHWEGGVWRRDQTDRVTDLVNDMVQEMWEQTAEEGDEEEVAKKQKALRPMLADARQKGAVSNLSRRRGVAISADDFDHDRSALTCVNGTLNLTDFSFVAHRREHLATKRMNVSYDPDATAPGWEKFLAEVLPSPELREYVQRAFGYTLTGDTDRKAIFMLHGPSHCGKSQILNAMEEIFGDFSATADANAFAQGGAAHGPNPSLHKLRGSRLVTASESGEGMPLNEALVKRITGGDKLTTRTLYQEDVTWQPRFAVWIATNHLPRMSSDDNAIWRRVKPIKFDQVFGTEDREEIFDIGRKLAASEGSGILNWLLEGVRKYREHGLSDPSEIKQGVKDYQSDSDPVSQFLESHIAEGVLKVDEGGEVDSRTLYSWFQTWCEAEGIRYPLARNRFGRRLATIGYEAAHDVSRTRRVWRGLALGSVSGPTVWLTGARQ